MRQRSWFAMAWLVLGAVAFASSAAWAQGKSGPRSIDAGGRVTTDELSEALKRPVQARKVPPATPASLGVSVCMWATADGVRTLSVTTYAAAAVERTHSKTLPVFYDSQKTSNANNAGRPAQVLPGIARHASFFPAREGLASTVLVHRHDCVIVINMTGLSKEEATAVAKAAATP